jgi:hypothetical protein
MVLATWEELTAALDEDDLGLLERFREICLALPGTEERVHRTEVQYRLARTYASGYVRMHLLELAVHLRREVSHPLLRQAFATTKTVTTHRLRIETLDELDSVVALIGEAHDIVGPGAGPG